MISEFRVLDKMLKTDGFETSFDYKIEDVKYQDGIYVVLLYIPSGLKEVDNIYGVDSDGKIVWRIENPIQAFNIEKDVSWYEHMASSIYVMMNLSLSGVFTATTFSAMKYTFDHRTGKLLDQEFMRW